MSGLPEKLACIGGGSIAEVLIERLLSTGAMQPGGILATDVRPDRLEELASRFGIHTSANNSSAPEFADWLILAVPPPAALPVLMEIQPLRAEHRVVSLAAAVPLAALQSAAAPAGATRVMPNAPSLVGEAMNLVAFPVGTMDPDRRSVTAVLDVFGRWQEVPDPAMNAWCALCAVGPTYLLPLLDALAGAAAANGISRQEALAASAQLAIGSGRLLAATGRSPDELKQIISLRTLAEPEGRALMESAYTQALQKLNAMSGKIGVAV